MLYCAACMVLCRGGWSCAVVHDISMYKVVWGCGVSCCMLAMYGVMWCVVLI